MKELKIKMENKTKKKVKAWENKKRLFNNSFKRLWIALFIGDKITK